MQSKISQQLEHLRKTLSEQSEGEEGGYVEPQQHGQNEGKRNVHRQWHEADAESHAEGSGDAASLQRPQARIGEEVGKRSRVPFFAQRLRLTTESTNERLDHGGATL